MQAGPGSVTVRMRMRLVRGFVLTNLWRAGCLAGGVGETAQDWVVHALVDH